VVHSVDHGQAGIGLGALQCFGVFDTDLDVMAALDDQRG